MEGEAFVWGGQNRTLMSKARVPSLIGIFHRLAQRKDIYIEHRAGKAARLASLRKVTQPSSFVGDGCFRVFPMHAYTVKKAFLF